MSKWHYLRLYPNQIKVTTESSALIQLPHKSDFDGWSFWHPAKLIKESHGSMTEMIYTNEFVFHLKKYGTGKYNKKEVIQQKDISAAKLVEIFQYNDDTYFEEPPLIYTPEYIEPEGAVADASLIDD